MENTPVTPGSRVLTPHGAGVINYVRMAPPDYREVAAVSVVLDSKKHIPSYNGSIVSVENIQPEPIAPAPAPEPIAEPIAPAAEDAPAAEPAPAWQVHTTRGAVAPSWAKAAIVAELERDVSDSMTDYFATRTETTVLIGWSAHDRDLFSEMRKAAATFPPTAHLGPGCDVWHVSVQLDTDIPRSNGAAYWKGGSSHWHSDALGIDGGTYSRTFETEAAARAWIAEQPADEPHPIYFDDVKAEFSWKVAKTSIEHREKYSMGAGYYLKGSRHYSDGWTVSKQKLYGTREFPEMLVYHAPTTKARATRAAAPATDAPTLTANPDKNGIEIRFPAKPAAEVLERLKANGWRWSRFSSCWYTKDTPAARHFAATLTEGSTNG